MQCSGGVCLGNVIEFYSIVIINRLNGSRFHMLEPRNRRAHDIVVSYPDPLYPAAGGLHHRYLLAVM